MEKFVCDMIVSGSIVDAKLDRPKVRIEKTFSNCYYNIREWLISVLVLHPLIFLMIGQGM